MWLLLLGVSVGSLHVRCPHYGATVLVDRRPVGRAPLAPLEVAAGLHLVEVRAESRIRWRRLVFVAPGSTVAVDAGWQRETARRPDARAPALEPAYDLSGRVGLEGATLGEGHDLDATYRWRLEGARVATNAVSTAVEIRGRGDVAGGPVLAGGQTADLTDSTLRLEEARLRYHGGRWRADAGRMYAQGPGVRAFAFDGARARARLSELRLALGTGRRAFDGGWLAHAGVAWAEHARVSVWYADTVHADLGGVLPLAPFSLRADGRTVGAALADGGARLQWSGRRDEAWAEARVRRGVRGPFEPSVPPLSWRRDVAGYEGRAGGRWGSLEASARGWEGETRSLTSRLSWLGPLGLGASLEGLMVDGDPLLAGRAGGGVDARWRAARWRLGARAGATWLRALDRDRWLPEASFEATFAVSGSLSVGARAVVAAVHPEVHPEGGPLAYGLLEAQLR